MAPRFARVRDRRRLCECHCPFRLARPAMTPTATAKRELSLATAMRELDAGNRNGRDAQRRLMARWSCSMRLFKYLFVRIFTLRQHGCSRRSSHSARRLGTWPSSVTLRGTRGSVVASVLRKNAWAAAMREHDGLHHKHHQSAFGEHQGDLVGSQPKLLLVTQSKPDFKDPDAGCARNSSAMSEVTRRVRWTMRSSVDISCRYAPLPQQRTTSSVTCPIPR